MINANKEVLDSIFTPNEEVAGAVSEDNNNKKDEKTKPHILRRNIEDYLERKALERKLLDVFDDDYPLD